MFAAGIQVNDAEITLSLVLAAAVALVALLGARALGRYGRTARRLAALEAEVDRLRARVQLLERERPGSPSTLPGGPDEGITERPGRR